MSHGSWVGVCRRGALAWMCLGLTGCAADAASSAGAGSDGGQDGGGDGANVGSDAGADATRDAAPPEPKCPDRTSTNCKPLAIGRPGAKPGPVAIVGDDVFWMSYDSVDYTKNKLVKTSLVTGDAVDVPSPADGDTWRALLATVGLVTDGKDVFALSDECCAGIQHAVDKLEPATGKWRFRDTQTSIGGVAGGAVAGGTVYVALGGTLVRGYATADLAIGTDYSDFRVGALGTDSSRLFALLVGTGQTSVIEIVGRNSKPVGKVALEALSTYGGVAVDDAYVYFGAGTKLLRVPKDGGTPDVVVDLAPNYPLRYVVDASTVRIVDEQGLKELPKGGGTPVLVSPFTNTSELSGLVQNDNWVVWTNDSGLYKLHK